MTLRKYDENDFEEIINKLKIYLDARDQEHFEEVFNSFYEKEFPLNRTADWPDLDYTKKTPKILIKNTIKKALQEGKPPHEIFSMLLNTLKDFKDAKGTEGAFDYLCLRCLQEGKIAPLPPEFTEDQIVECPECGWINDDFEEAGADKSAKGFTIFIQVPEKGLAHYQQCHVPLQEKDVDLLPDKTKDAVKTELDLELPLKNNADTYHEFTQLYQQYLQGDLGEKQLISAIQSLPQEQDPRTSDRKKRDWDLIDNLRTKDPGILKRQIAEKKAQLNVSLYFKNH